MRTIAVASISIVQNGIPKRFVGESDIFNVKFEVGEEDYIPSGYYIYELVGGYGFTQADLVNVYFNNGSNSLISGFSGSDLANGSRYGYSQSFTITQDLIPESTKIISINLRHSSNISQVLAASSVALKDDDVPISCGTFAIQFGSDLSDIKSAIGSGIAYFSGGGDDSIALAGFGELNQYGRAWVVPAIASGGGGSDTYSLSNGSNAIIYDASNSVNDSLRIFDFFGNVVEFFSVEQRHIFIYTAAGTNLILVDALNERGTIETIQFSDQSFSGSPNSVKSLVSLYQTRSDQSFDALVSSGLFNPAVAGVTSAQGVRDIINSVYTFNNSRNSVLGSLSLNSNTMQLLYAAYYGRPGDAGGIQFWQAKIAESNFSYSPRAGDGLTELERPLYDRLVSDFGNSIESQRLYAGKSATASVDSVYNYCFGRKAEIDPITGQNYWVGKLERREVTLSQLAAEVALGAQGQDLTFLESRILSADLFYSSMDTFPEQAAYSTDATATLARNWLTQFGGTLATSVQAEQIVQTIVTSI